MTQTYPDFAELCLKLSSEATKGITNASAELVRAQYLALAANSEKLSRLYLDLSSSYYGLIGKNNLLEKEVGALHLELDKRTGVKDEW